MSGVADRKMSEARARRAFAHLVRTLALCHAGGRVAFALRTSAVLVGDDDEVALAPGTTCAYAEYASRPYPAYASPESMTGSLSPSDDVWAAGVVLYVWLHGRYPFYADHQSELVRRVLTCRLAEPTASAEACMLLYALLRRGRPALVAVQRSRWLCADEEELCERRWSV